MDPVLGEVAPVILFLIPVAFSAWFGGLLPGLTATACGVLAGIGLFSTSRSPVGGVQHGTAFYWLARGLPFCIVGTIISVFAA